MKNVKKTKTVLFVIIISIIMILIHNRIKYRNIEREVQNVNEPNKPIFTNNMIPIYFDENTGDSLIANIKEKWYDYQNGRWANIVIVTNDSKNYYINSQPDTIIKKSDILAYFVWIPRYKYKVFNINRKLKYESYQAKKEGIKILFEEGTSTTGQIKCNYNYKTNGMDNLNDRCTGSNGQYYTHPAFTFDNVELEGIWVGKYETTGSIDNPTINDIDSILLNLNISNQFKISKLFNSAKYLPESEASMIDFHMMKNTDWGAVAYLAHSSYGVCKNGGCKEFSSSDNITSTTNNIYGIFGMANGIKENVMANISNTKNVYKFNESYSEFSDEWYNNNQKYINEYAFNDLNIGENSIKNSMLGDAMGEISNWFNDNLAAYNEVPWIERDGNRDYINKYKMFSYNGNFGYNIRANGFRVIITYEKNQ